MIEKEWGVPEGFQERERRTQAVLAGVTELEEGVAEGRGTFNNPGMACQEAGQGRGNDKKGAYLKTTQRLRSVGR